MGSCRLVLLKRCMDPPPPPGLFECILLHLWKVQLKKQVTGWLVVEMQLPNICPKLLSQPPQRDTGRRQDGHGAGDRILRPRAITPVMFEAITVTTFTSARLVSQLKYCGGCGDGQGLVLVWQDLLL